MENLGYLMIAFGIGFFSSVPLGPGGLMIMDLASRGRTAKALRAVLAFLLADSLVLGVCWTFSVFLKEYLENPWCRIASGMFLIIFSIFFLKAVKKKAMSSEEFEREPGKTSIKVFNLTLMNPGVWLGLFFVLSLRPGSIPFAVSFEAGVMTWYLIVVFGVKYLKREVQLLLQRIAARALFLTGVYYMGMPIVEMAVAAAKSRIV